MRKETEYSPRDKDLFRQMTNFLNAGGEHPDDSEIQEIDSTTATIQRIRLHEEERKLSPGKNRIPLFRIFLLNEVNQIRNDPLKKELLKKTKSLLELTQRYIDKLDEYEKQKSALSYTEKMQFLGIVLMIQRSVFQMSDDWNSTYKSGTEVI